MKQISFNKRQKMALHRTPFWQIPFRTSLLGATAGIIVGLIEAACLRLPDMPLALRKAHVAPSFWVFAPLLASMVFGVLGLLAGFLATLTRSRFFGMVMIAGLAGLTGSYFRLVLQFYPSGPVWFIFLREIIPPNLVFALVFSCTLAVLWTTRRPGSPLGALADIPIRLWSVVVIGSMATMAVALGASRLPKHLMASTAHAMGRSQSPNIVLIVWDTSRADHFSSNGYFRNTTPNTDEFAQRGVLFENAISAASWTLPGTTSIFTGLLPHQHGASADTVLGSGPRTLAELLRVGGYETAGFNANPYFGVDPCGLARGFETYIDSTPTLGYSLDASHIGHEFIEPYSEEWFHRSRFNQYTAHQLNEQVYDWFDHRSERPFFLFLNYNDAHDTYEVPSPYDHVYGRISEKAKLLLPEAKLGRIELSADEREGVIAAYDNSLKYIDSQVGELLRYLERSPQWSNTYVIITADHGEAFGEHHTYTHGWDLYREVLHVPLVIVGPGIPAGVRITDTVGTRRIFATALEFAGAKGAVLHRSSLSRLWTPGSKQNTLDESTLSEVIVTSAPGQGMISITTSEWHFIIYYTGHGHSQLYHWTTDPMEREDVSELPENQAIVEHLKSTLLSKVERSYRPWRDTRYLLAFSGSDFPHGVEAIKPSQPTPGTQLLPPGAGAVQALFPPNPETPQSNDKKPDEELLNSLPYDAR